MGRPRKPTAALERTGNLRADRHGQRKNEPQFDGTPTRPAGLSADARKHWDAIVPRLTTAGVAKAIDAPALTAMCDAWSEYCSARRIKTYDLHERRQRQMLINGALKAWRDLAARFGMTPADRAKLEVGPDGEEGNGFEALLQQQIQSQEKGKGKAKT